MVHWGMAEVSAVHASTLFLDRSWHMTAHQHDPDNEMIVVLEGRIQTEIGGERVGGGPGTALLYPARMKHEEWAVGGRPLTTICIAWLGPAPAGPREKADVRGRITELARWLSDLSADPAPEAREIAKGLLAALLHEYARPARRPGGDLLDQVRAFAGPRLTEDLSLDDLAHHAGLSRFHFVRAFRAAAGTTPMRWLRHQRLHAARGLLLTTDLPLRVIATRVGFKDEFQLSRVFRRDTGRAPSSLRGAP
jgi:AraC-like DNA-binding protein/mannose-6-phosphate isomerase-like protein (cupin superfamily)